MNVGCLESSVCFCILSQQLKDDSILIYIGCTIIQAQTLVKNTIMLGQRLDSLASARKMFIFTLNRIFTFVLFSVFSLSRRSVCVLPTADFSCFIIGNVIIHAVCFSRRKSPNLISSFSHSSATRQYKFASGLTSTGNFICICAKCEFVPCP